MDQNTNTLETAMPFKRKTACRTSDNSLSIACYFYDNPLFFLANLHVAYFLH